MKMGLVHAGLLLLMFRSVCNFLGRSGVVAGLFVQNPESEWAKMETKINEKMMPVPAPEDRLWKIASHNQSTTPAPRTIPWYLVMSGSKDPKDLFKPGQGAGALPNSVVNLLRGSPSNALPIVGIRDPNLQVEILCHVDRMYVRIKKQVFKTLEAYKYLKLGTCPVNAGTSIHYYLLYLLTTDCGFTQESKADYVYISNVLSYKPTTPVLREMPFTIPLLCKYPRSFYSYDTGFFPKLQRSALFKALVQKAGLTLAFQDAKGNEITGTKTYTMGEVMYFEAKQSANTGGPGALRIYINKCFMTASADPNSNPKYAVIDNQGCMVDSKVTNDSMFLTGTSMNTQKFSVGAFVFANMVSASSATQKLYMHCEIAIGKLASTPSLKACNYDPATNMWKELYGNNSVCTCCNSTCPSLQPRAFKKMISSPSWKVDLSGTFGYVGANPQMRPSEPDPLSFEDPYQPDKDLQTYWKHDYKKSRGNGYF